jgi:hypothetical protein
MKVETVTRKDMYKRSIYHIASFSVLLVVCMLGGFIYIFLDGVLRGISIMFGIPLILAALGSIYACLESLSVLKLIKKQEQYFDFDFDEQMYINDVKKSKLREMDSFENPSFIIEDIFIIQQEKGKVFALKQDYVERFKEEKGVGTSRAVAADKDVTIFAVDKSKFHMGLSNYAVRDFRRWIKKKSDN